MTEKQKEQILTDFFVSPKGKKLLQDWFLSFPPQIYREAYHLEKKEPGWINKNLINVMLKIDDLRQEEKEK